MIVLFSGLNPIHSTDILMSIYTASWLISKCGGSSKTPESSQKGPRIEVMVVAHLPWQRAH